MGRPGTSLIPIDGGEKIVDIFKPGMVGNAPQSRSRRHPPVTVYIESGRGTGEFAPSERFEMRSVKPAMDGGDTTATLYAGLDADKLTTAGEIGEEHFAHLLDMLSPDRRVRIAQSFGALPARVYFQGYPQVSTITWHERGQAVSCMCLSEGQEILRTHELAQVYERRMRRDPLFDWIPAQPDDRPVAALLPVFNAGNRPNRSPHPYVFQVDDRKYRIHLFLEDDAPEAAYWSYADALRYLVFMYVLRMGLAVSVADFMSDTAELSGLSPCPDSADPLVRRLTSRIDDISVASVNVEEAVCQLTEAAGVHYLIETRNVGDRREVEVEHRLRVFAALNTRQDQHGAGGTQMGIPKVLDIPREAPFTPAGGRSDYAIALSTRATQVSLTHDRRAINVPIILGGRRWYEVTLLLRPGWLPHENLDNLDDEVNRLAAIHWWEMQFELRDEGDLSIYHGKHPDHWEVNDVGRLWIFPDDHRYMTDRETSPYARSNWPDELYSPYDPNDVDRLVLCDPNIGGNIEDAANWVPRRRPLGNTIARVRASGDQEPVVRVNFSVNVPEIPSDRPYTALEQDGWQDFGGTPYIDTHRAAVYFREDDLWKAQALWDDPKSLHYDYDNGNMLKAFINGRFMVAVTCTVCGDGRLAYQARTHGASFARDRHAMIDTGFGKFRDDRRRGLNSVFDDQPIDADPQFEDRFDVQMLNQFGDRQAEILVGDTISGPVEIMYLDPSYRLGDCFSGVDGLGLSFNSFPEIVRIEYVYDPAAGYRTLLHLSDLRSRPEVDSE